MKTLSIVMFTCLSTLANPTFAYDIDTYLKKLDQNSVTTLDEAISALPTAIKSHFTLLHQGHGLRGTSYLEPAAILFDPQGSFFVNIGSPHQAMGNEIEILQFNRVTRKTELYSLEFPLKRNSAGQIVRPAPNPKKCLSCHGTEPKVLWGDYNNWLGAYQTHTDKDEMKGEELAYFNAFRKENRDKTPYKNLIFNPKNKFSPFYNEKLNQTSPDAVYSLEIRPNTHLGFLATRINAAVYGRQIEESPNLNAESLYIYTHSDEFCKMLGFPLKRLDDKALLKQFGIDSNDAALKINDGFNDERTLLSYQIMRILQEKFQDKIFSKYYHGMGLASDYHEISAPIPKAILAIDSISLKLKLRKWTPEGDIEQCRDLSKVIGL